MRFATRNEIEYLGSVDGTAAENPKLIDELSQRLDALRRYDQNFSTDDWRPRPESVGGRHQSSRKAS